MGTPSAPPIFEGVGHIPEVQCESSKESLGFSGIQQSHDEVNMQEKLTGDVNLAHDGKLESSVSERLVIQNGRVYVHCLRLFS